MNRQSAFAVALAASATAALGFAAAPASAFTLAPGAQIFTTPVTLDKLVGTNNAFQVKDKIFHNFIFQPSCFGPQDQSCDDVLNLPPADRPVSPLKPQQVTVGPSENSITTSSGIGLLLNDDWRADPGWVYDLAFGFDVEVVEGSNQSISDVHLKIVSEFPEDTGVINIGETVSDPDSGAVLATLFADNLSSTSKIGFVDGKDLEDPVKQLRVLKDIKLRGTQGETAQFSILIQEFSQTTDVPEPAAVGGLLAIGSIGIGAILKRHRQEKNKLDS